MWYIQNEIVSGVYGTPHRFGISRILRFKVAMRATQPLLDKGMNFGVRVAFDSGMCTGPGCDFDWRNYGYNVGCNRLGNYPFPQYNTHYRDAVWYSLPGTCPSKSYLDVTSVCEAQEPGGRCSGIPTGTGNCTWNYEPAGNLTFRELYGNQTMNEFWANPNDDAANQRKVDAARALLAAKYGGDPPTPPCDFNFDRFYG